MPQTALAAVRKDISASCIVPDGIFCPPNDGGHSGFRAQFFFR